MKPNKMEHPNQGIICEVTNCHYHMSGDQCLAEKIQVTPKEAKNSRETDCATFIPQDK